MNPILRKWLQFRAGAIPSEPFETPMDLKSGQTTLLND